jgi:hypothetical protein
VASLPVLAVVHEQPIEMDHVIRETNRVRQPQNFFSPHHYFFSNDQ